MSHERVTEMKKNNGSILQPRRLVQIIFVLASVYIGWRFVNYFTYLQTAGASGSPLRPAGVEAFVPLSALVGLKAWLSTGAFDPIHPAGLTILLLAILVSLVLRKAFCSWICPFGFLEEMLSWVGVKVRPKKLVVPKWLDIALRSIKYILLFLFVAGVFLMMSGLDAVSFVQSPYNMMVDVKMLLFFINISAVGVGIFAFLIIMSLFLDHFWCRYLCPYGALLGLFGWFSPARIQRDAALCINCRACDQACPGRLSISSVKKVASPECHSCLSCIAKCPVSGALEYNFLGRFGRNKYFLPAAVLIIFILGVAAAKLTGHWNSSLDVKDAMVLFKSINNI